jgi:hypothetical protein
VCTQFVTACEPSQDVLHDVEAVSGADNIALRVRPTPEGMAYVAANGITMPMAEDPHGYDAEHGQQGQASDKNVLVSCYTCTFVG